MAKSASRRQQAVQEDKKTVAQGVKNLAQKMGQETDFGDFVREGRSYMTPAQHQVRVDAADRAKQEFEETGSPEAAESMISITGQNNRRMKRGRVKEIGDR